MASMEVSAAITVSLRQALEKGGASPEKDEIEEDDTVSNMVLSRRRDHLPHWYWIF
jgi:hypothetical protein